MRKPVFGICENKDADQLRGNRESDQRLCFGLNNIYSLSLDTYNTYYLNGTGFDKKLKAYKHHLLRCFRYTDSTIPPLPKSEISSL